MSDYVIGAVIIAVALLVTAPLYAATSLLLALGAKAWSSAVISQHSVRHAQLQVQSEEQALEAVMEPRPRAAYVPPSELDLEDAILAERAVADEREYSTIGNEGYEEQPPIPEGGLYRNGVR